MNKLKKCSGVLLLLTILFVSCKEERVVEEKALQNRNGIFYEVNSQTPFTGKTVSYYDADNDVIKIKQIKGEMSLKDGVVNGHMIAYYRNGQIQEDVEFKKGIPHGNYKLYYEDGTLMKEGNTKDGKKEGLHKSYYENGQVEFEENYLNDNLDGTRKTYYTNGSLQTIRKGKEKALQRLIMKMGRLVQKKHIKMMNEMEFKKITMRKMVN